jgi:ABC-type Mn2+/Zn2+ transport system permease subunit
VTWLTEPLALAFFVRALAAGVLVGAMCGAVGVFVVLRRMSYIGHGLSHSVLGGVAIAAAAGVSIYLGAAVATLASAVLIDRVARARGLHADAAIGIVTTAMFALGVLVVSRVGGGRVNTEALLFGSILGVFPGDLAVAGATALVLGALLVRYHKPLVFTAFDRQVAAVQGVRTGRAELLLTVLVAAVIIVSVRVLGVLLIAAAVVIPAAIARLLTRSFGRMVLLSAGLGAATSVVGLYASYHLDVASGASIVMVQAVAFAAVAGAAAAAGRATLASARSRARAAPIGSGAPRL